MTTEHPNDMEDMSSKNHINAVLIALFVTVLWASSWIIIKFGLEDIPPLTFAGLRYTLAAGILMAFIIAKDDSRLQLKSLAKRDLFVLSGYGLVFVTITQGAQFLGLAMLDAIAVSLLLNVTPLIVLILGIGILKEIPSFKQIGLILVGIGGVVIYFYPLQLELLEAFGIIVVAVGVIANAFSSIIGRTINKSQTYTPILVTGVSMLIGSVVLLSFGLLLEGMSSLSPLSILYIIWLSVVNTAFAFTLWNKAMQTLRAIDISIINGTMLPQIVILSILFLGEHPDFLDWIGLILIAVSAVSVQVLQERKLHRGVNASIYGANTS